MSAFGDERRAASSAWSVPGCGVDAFPVARRASGWVAKETRARRGESRTWEPRGGPMGSGFFSSGFFSSAGAASSCGGRERERGGERTERCARARSDRRDRRDRRVVFSCVAAVAGRRAPGRRATGNRKRPIGPRMPFERGMGRTAARTRRATRAFFWALAENLLLREEQGRGTARSVARSRAREGPLPGRKSYRDTRSARASLVTDFPNQRVCVRETLARARSRTYPETAARAASWGAAAQIAAIASEVWVWRLVRVVCFYGRDGHANAPKSQPSQKREYPLDQ